MSAEMSAEKRAAREAELYEAVKAADAALREASQPADRENTEPDYAAWWQGIAEAHTTLGEAYNAALTSGLWPTASLMWTALMEARWHNQQEAKRVKHEADLESTRTQRRDAVQPECAS